ncbi:MAG: aminopeptidase P N-terminal domain-containing protein [Pseudomonadota bacterium]
MIERKEYARRRRRVIEELGDDCVAIIPTAPVRRRNRDIEYRFRPDSDFFYLTGFPEPRAVAVLVPGRPQGEYLLFCEDREADAVALHGPVAGPEGAVSRYGADDAFPITDMDEILPGLMERSSRLYYSLGSYTDFDHRVFGWMHDLRRRSRHLAGPGEVVALNHILHDMRLIKSAAELRAIGKAIEATEHGHRRAMAAARPGVGEALLEAELRYGFAEKGCRHTAYPCIVASGANGCVMHYIDNEGVLSEGDLVLVDAGAESAFYAADVTRTFPVSGRFTDTQKALYELVLEAQQAGIEAARIGADVNAPHRAAVAIIARGLLNLGLLEGSYRDVMRTEAFRQYYMHPSTHWLGLDVHDVGDYKFEGEWRELEAGMVLTVEPGIYIGADAAVPVEWRGTAIRIEDDILVTRDGPEVLSASLGKSVADVEAMVGASASAATGG